MSGIDELVLYLTFYAIALYFGFRDSKKPVSSKKSSSPLEFGRDNVSLELLVGSAVVAIFFLGANLFILIATLIGFYLIGKNLPKFISKYKQNDLPIAILLLICLGTLVYNLTLEIIPAVSTPVIVALLFIFFKTKG